MDKQKYTTMKNLFSILFAAIAIFLLSQSVSAATLKENGTLGNPYDYVVQQYLNAGFKIDSTTSETNTFKSPKECLKELRKWQKDYDKKAISQEVKVKNIKVKVGSIPKILFWNCDFKETQVSFETTSDPVTFRPGSEMTDLVGRFVLGPGCGLAEGDAKAQASGDEVKIEATTNIQFRVVIDGKVLSKKQIRNKYIVVTNLKNRTASVQKIM